MKHLVVVFFVLVNSLVFAQATEISGNYDKIGKFDKGIAIVQKGGLVGVINSEGKEIVKPQYERITGFGTDGIAYTRKNDQVGLINREGHVIVDNMYDYIGHFKGGNAIIKKNDLCGVINTKGKIIIDIKYQKLSIEEGGLVKATNPDGTVVLLKTN